MEGIKMYNKNEINILYASDDNFSPYLGVSIFSLLKHNHDDFDKINIYILNKGISENNIGSLLKVSKNFLNCNLIFIEDKGISEILGRTVKGNRALSSFSRLLASSFLDSSISKVLYLDADSLIVGSFKDLWETDISKYYCAGVLDIGPDYVKTAIGLKNNTKYINAGVLLINLEKWREDDIEACFIDFLEKNDFEVYNNDQGILNGVLNENILIVNPKFNFMSPFLEKGYEDIINWNGLKNHYSKSIIDNARKNAVFLHFVPFINGRPWFKDTNHPCKKLYLKYANQTPFKDSVLVDDQRKFRYRFVFSIVKYIPFNVFCWGYKIYRCFLIKYI